MSPTVLLTLALSSLLLATLTAIGTRVLQRFSRHELQEYCRKKSRPDIFDRIMDSYDQFTLTAESLQVLATVVLLLAGSLYLFGTNATDPRLGTGRLLGAIVTGTFILLMITSWIPWSIARIWAVPFLFHTWRIWWVLSYLAWPLAAGVSVFAALLSRFSSRNPNDVDEEEALEDEIMSIVTTGEREGLLESAAREMIEGVIELDDLTVGELMTPRSKVDALDSNLPWSELIEKMSAANRSRYPVFDGTPDHVVGTLVVRDLLPFFVKGELPDRPLKELVRPALVVPDKRLSDEMLSEFLHSRQHLAIVVDEYHVVVGILTIEDVLEEIVGEIVDESEKHLEQDILKAQPGVAVVMGHVRIDELNDELHLTLPESDEYDTVAGMLIAHHREIPANGTTLALESATLTVLEATARQIVRVKVEASNQMNQPTSAAS